MVCWVSKTGLFAGARVLLYPVIWLWLQTGLALGATPPVSEWVSWSAQGEPQIQLYFFWTGTCPHCRQARPFIEALTQQYPWLQLHSFEIDRDLAGRLRYQQMAAALGQEARSVPAFLACGALRVGYDHAEGIGRELRELLLACRQHYSEQPLATPPPGEPATTGLPLPWGDRIDPHSLSLPILTLTLAGLDAFNPCAFFVLLFLLSLLVHTRQRRRMLLIGGVFIITSGVVYFLFMAAWLNAFRLIGEWRWVTWLAGALAVVIGGLNVKDYFWFKQGPSLSIPETAKPDLFRRMRGLLSADSVAMLLLGAVTLALAANSYELLCTVGFPLIYTRTLTLHQLSSGGYYGYLALYNLIYILPLLLILVVFVWTLGARKLQDGEGRVLKLGSGTMMWLLGLMLLVYPQGLSHAGIALLVLLVALALTGIIVWVDPQRAGKGSG